MRCLWCFIWAALYRRDVFYRIALKLQLDKYGPDSAFREAQEPHTPQAHDVKSKEKTADWDSPIKSG